MLKDVEKLVNIKVEKAINECLDILKTSIDEKTPEDTKKLLGNNMIEKAKIVGDNLVGKVYNETPYGIYVEYGVKSKAYNYNKPKGTIFYTGVGARMFTKSFDEKKQEITNIITKSLKNE